MTKKAGDRTLSINRSIIYLVGLMLGMGSLVLPAVDQALSQTGSVYSPILITPPVEITGILQGRRASKHYKFEHTKGCAKIWMVNQSAGHMVVALLTPSDRMIISKTTLSTSNRFGGSGISQRVPGGTYLARVQLGQNWDAGSFTIQIASVVC